MLALLGLIALVIGIGWAWHRVGRDLPPNDPTTRAPDEYNNYA